MNNVTPFSPLILILIITLLRYESIGDGEACKQVHISGLEVAALGAGRAQVNPCALARAVGQNGTRGAGRKFGTLGVNTAYIIQVIGKGVTVTQFGS